MPEKTITVGRHERTRRGSHETVPDHTRTLKQVEVHWTCIVCGQEQSRMQYPGGRKPEYCATHQEANDLQAKQDDRAKAAERMRRLREGRRP